jgi:hypothetical protein
MKVYIVWFAQLSDDDEFIGVFKTEEGAKDFIKERKTFGNEGLYYAEYDVMDGHYY